MFKLVFFLIGLGLAILFAAVNIGYTSDLSLLFVKFTDVPIFLSISLSFLIGAVFTLPFAFTVSLGTRRKNSKSKKNDKPIEVEEAVNDLPPNENEKV